MENKDRPAFPTNTDLPYNLEGLSKREYFAGLAMQGVLASRQPYKVRMTVEQVAREAIGLADELLRQLKEQ